MTATQLDAFRGALQAGDPGAALRTLKSLTQQCYPLGLLRSVLATCHPGLDPAYVDPQLVPEELLLAGRFPQLADRSGLDPLRIDLCHGCDLGSFVTQHLNAVLRGDQPLYRDLPALEIRQYRHLLQLEPELQACLHQRSALAWLALEADALRPGMPAPLKRWYPSAHDAQLEHPWLLINTRPEHALIQATNLATTATLPIHDLESAEAICRDAASRLLGGGSHYLLWNSPDPPPAIWADWIRGLVASRHAPLVQLGEVDGLIGEVVPPRAQSTPALLAINASWLARRQPHQVQSFIKHWLHGPSQLSSVRIDPSLVLGPATLARPTQLEGLLVLAATSDQVQRVGEAALLQRARSQAIQGGFQDAAVLQLGLPLTDQLAAWQREGWVWAFLGPEDAVAPGAWSCLRQQLSWQPNQLVCSDEELLWCPQPDRHGLRQFAAGPTLTRLLCRGLVPGLVALPAEQWSELDLQPSYASLHALLKHIGLQWLAKHRPCHCLPQALLHRHPYSNPAVLPISPPNLRHCFTAEQLLELKQLTLRTAADWLQPGGSLEPGSIPGTFLVRYCPTAHDRLSVIIPFRDQAQLTRTCVLSLLEQAAPMPLELILLDNGSDDAEAMGLAGELAAVAANRGVHVVGLRDEQPFNFSALNNLALQACSGNFILFLNNDIRLDSPGALWGLIHPFGLASTGAVSSRLLFEDGTIQHHGLAAVAYQSHDILSPAKGLRPGLDTDPFTMLQVQEEWSAATAACLLMRRSDLDQLNGFDESFAVAYNDVDLCWRLRQQGRAVVVTPEPQITHAESKTRGDDIAGEKRNRLAQESGTLRQRFSHYFQEGDPLYHPFLAPASHRFEPMALPAKPLTPSRDRLLFSWIRPNFEAAPERPFLIYVHWDPQGSVRADVLEQLRAYRHYTNVVFVSASPEMVKLTQQIKQLQDLCDVLLIRHNEGYDFGSWKAGIQFCERWVRNTKQLILTNDSCYGPLQSLDSLFQRLEDESADVIGLTASTDIRPHLQSYFLAYNKRVIRSPLFWTFWEQISCWSSKFELVMACEVGWSVRLEEAGFRLQALYFDGSHGNVTHTRWRPLVEQLQFPFLKTELLRVNPIRQDIDAWFDVASSLDPSIARSIREHLDGTDSSHNQ